MHTTIRSHTCFSTGSKLHDISQPPWLSAVSKIHKLKQSHDLTLQICANPCFAWWNQHHRRAPRPSATKSQKLGPQQKSHAPTCAASSSRMSPRTIKNLEIQLDHSHTRRHVGLIAWWSAKPEKFGRLSRSHAPIRAVCVSRSFPRTTTISSCVAHQLATRAVLSTMLTTDLPTEEIWLTTTVARASLHHLGFWLPLHASMNISHSIQKPKTAADVIWRHRMTSSLHVSSHASTSTSTLVHVNGSTARPVTRPENPELTRTSIRWLWSWTSWLWLFALTFDQKSKFPKGRI